MEKHKRLVKNIKHKIVKRVKGFTLVELIVVIVVIGILSAIGVVSYGEITKKVAVSQIKNDLLGAAAAMEKIKSRNSKYPDSLPSDFKYSADTNFTGPGGITVISLSGGSGYCIEATSIKRSSIGTFSISSYGSNTKLYEGSCEQNLIDNNVYLWKQLGTGCGITYNGKFYCYASSDSPFKPVETPMTGALSGKTVKSLSSNGSSYCIIASDDKAYCKGLNNYGQVGDGSTIRRDDYVAVDTSGELSGKIITSIATNYSNHTCAITSEGKAYCWGYNTYGGLGNNSTTPSPLPVPVNTAGQLNGKVLTSISVGNYFTCALATDGNAYCWGYNSNGRLGNGLTAQSNVPVKVSLTGELTGLTIKQVVSGPDSSCLIASNNKAYCWGSGTYGRLGNNGTAQSTVPTPMYTAGVLNGLAVQQISVSTYGGCLIANNKLYCWGGDSGHRLGAGNAYESDSLVPVAVSTNGGTKKEIFQSINDGCALAFSGKIYCWGYIWEHWPDSGLSYATYPLLVGTNDSHFYNHTTLKVSSLATNHQSTCVIAPNTKVYCWGSNEYDQLATDAEWSLNYPVALGRTGLINGKVAQSISAGAYHTCAVTTDSLAYCWGRNTNGQLGNNSTTQSRTPVAVDTSTVLSGKTFKSISAGANHTCAIASDDKVYCWGVNTNGQLGNNSTTQSPVPVAVDATTVLSGKTMRYVYSSSNYTCAVDSNEKAYCWGGNTSGQLGNNSTAQSLVPVAVDTTGVLSGKTIKALSVNTTGSHNCVIASDNKAYCWGRNGTFGSNLGNNSNTSSSVPVEVDATGVLSGKTIKSITVGPARSCAVASDNKAYCWGMNDVYGELGDKTYNNAMTPIAVYTDGALNGKSLVSVYAGRYHTCVVDSDSYVYCWGGEDEYSELGSGATAVDTLYGGIGSGSPEAVPVWSYKP